MGSRPGKISPQKTVVIMEEVVESEETKKLHPKEPNQELIIKYPTVENADSKKPPEPTKSTKVVEEIKPLTAEEIEKKSEKILSNVKTSIQKIGSEISSDEALWDFMKNREESLMCLYRAYYALKGAPIESMRKLRLKIGEEFSKANMVSMFCKIVTVALNTGYRDENGLVIKEVHTPLKLCLLLLLNFSDCCISVVEAICAEPQFLESLVSQLTAWQPAKITSPLKEADAKILKWMLSIVHNCSMVESSISRLRSLDFTSTLIPFLSSNSEVTQLQAMASLADIVDEKESEVLQTHPDNIQFVMTVLGKSLGAKDRRHIGWSAKELGRTVRRLARNDANKKLLVTEGALPLLVELAQTGNEDEQEEALLSLWMLAFDEDNRKTMTADEDVMKLLIHFNKSANSALKNASYGALWTMRHILKDSEKYKELGQKICGEVDSLSRHSLDSDTGHVMISYQWNDQHILIRVRDELRANGFKVWMDIDDMGGSTLQAMADAVEKASVILICMSQKYKDSPNCRAEAEYAFQRRKLIIPLKMQRGYEADGWLGFIVGTKLYYEFSGQYSFESRAQNLLKELKMKLKGSQPALADEVDFVEPVHSVPLLMSAPNFDALSVNQWTSTQVLAWLDEHQLEREKFGKLTGLEIAFLKNLKIEAPEFFYKTLTEMVGIKDLLTLSRFVRALGHVPVEDQSAMDNIQK
ncbi:hypothetical protein ScPMuIL_007854 [Solemya velum]